MFSPLQSIQAPIQTYSAADLFGRFASQQGVCAHLKWSLVCSSYVHNSQLSLT